MNFFIPTKRHGVRADQLIVIPKNGSSGDASREPIVVKNTWISRRLDQLGSTFRFEQSNNRARAGDCVCVRVTRAGNHTRIFTDDNRYSRLYEGDYLVGVVGSRYATDAYHARQIDASSLHVLTNAGLFGTVCDQHSSMKSPTGVGLIGYLIDSQGKRINTMHQFFHPAKSVPTRANPVLIVGTGMNSGKTTSTARLGQSLTKAGHCVAIVKLTGSASHRDVHEFEATGAVFTADFTDYGFPSTYMTTVAEMEGLYCRMMVDAEKHAPDVVLVEVADGAFQRETQFLLNSELVRTSACGAILTAACAPSALALNATVRQSGWDPIAITGLITNSPLFEQELVARCETPVCDTGKRIEQICDRIMARIQSKKFIGSR